MLFGMTSPVQLPMGPLTPRVEVVPAGDQRSVFLNGHLVARYPCHDRVTERIFVTQLAEVLPLPDRQLAAAFGLHPVTLSRFRQQARPGGAAALMPRKTGPQRPHKIESATGGPLPRFARSGALLAGYRRAPVAPRLNYLPPPRGGPVPRPADPAPPTGPRTMVALVEIDRPGSQANMVRVIARLRPSSSLSPVSHDRGFTL